MEHSVPLVGLLNAHNTPFSASPLHTFPLVMLFTKVGGPPQPVQQIWTITPLHGPDHLGLALCTPCRWRCSKADFTEYTSKPHAGARGVNFWRKRLGKVRLPSEHWLIELLKAPMLTLTWLTWLTC